jgi:hypothetical protein
VFREDDAKTQRDIGILSFDAGAKTQPLLRTTFNEENAEISPDGRWTTK